MMPSYNFLLNLAALNYLTCSQIFFQSPQRRARRRALAMLPALRPLVPWALPHISPVRLTIGMRSVQQTRTRVATTTAAAQTSGVHAGTRLRRYSTACDRVRARRTLSVMRSTLFRRSWTRCPGRPSWVLGRATAQRRTIRFDREQRHPEPPPRVVTPTMIMVCHTRSLITNNSVWF